jgi:hypothetical protein
MTTVDIITDDSGELLFFNGDLVFDASANDHIRDILLASPGQYRQFPLLGAGIKRLINGKLNLTERRNIKLHLESDNYDVAAVSTVNDQLVINAERKI